MRKFIYLLVGILFSGCGGSDRPSKPDNLISTEKMSDIIYDVFMLNSAKGINKRILEQNGVSPQDYVYKKHKIDSLQFAKSNDYYSYDTKTYEAIMDKVKQKLEIEKKINEALILKQEKTKDSLKEIELKGKDSLLISLDDLIPESDTTPPIKTNRKPKIFGKDED